MIAEEKAALLAAIIASSEDAIVSKTLKGIITSWNPAATRLFGYSEAEAIGQHISLIIPDERLPEEDFIIGQVSEGNRVEHFETVRRHKDGSMVSLSLSVSPVLNTRGEVIGASKIARDIAEQKALYAQIKVLSDRKDEFISLASHELKTPLTSIHGYLDILSRLSSDEKSLQIVKKTQLQVKKLNALVTDLLDISKIEAGNLRFSMAQFDALEMVDNVIELATLGSPGYHIKLLTGVERCTVYGDVQRIEQVLMNLLSNAVRYSPGKQRIDVSLACDQDAITISVKDYGIGIDADKLEHIFKRFYRVEDPATRVSGLGIGLYLSHEIISRHQGKLWAESEPGQGSTFYFRLPIANSSSNS